MFRGTFQTTIDHRGYVRLPRKFVEVLRAMGDERMVVTADPAGGFRRLSVRPFASWVTLEDRMRKQLDTGLLEDDRSRFVQYYFSTAQELVLDTRGRTKIPPYLREYAHLVDGITFTGGLDQFSIWKTDVFDLAHSAFADEFAQRLPQFFDELLDGSIADSPGKRIEVIPVARDLTPLLRADMGAIHDLSPDEFERFVSELLEQVGLRTTRVGNVYAPDGGIDIIACPADSSAYPFILAVQAKHHKRASRKTGAPEVQQFAGTLAAQRLFNAGMIVTSTTFTPSAIAVARQLPTLRLRDFRDLTRWVAGNLHEYEWREIPARIELFPGHFIDVPRPPLISSR